MMISALLFSLSLSVASLFKQDRPCIKRLRHVMTCLAPIEARNAGESCVLGKDKGRP